MKVCSGEKIPRGQSGHSFYVKFTDALQIFQEQSKILSSATGRIRVYVRRIALVKDGIDYEIENKMKKTSFESDKLSEQIYGYYRKNLLKKGISRTNQEIEESDSYLSKDTWDRNAQLHSGGTSPVKEHMQETMENSIKGRSRAVVIEKLKKDGEISNETADSLQFSTGYETNDGHNHFTCKDHEECALMRYWDDVGYSMYFPGQGGAFLEILRKINMLNWFYPHESYDKERFYLEHHPVNAGEREALASINDEILNSLTEFYPRFLELVYFGDLSKSEETSKKYFDQFDSGNPENNPFIHGDASSFRTIKDDQGYWEQQQYSISNFFSAYQDGFKDANKLISKMGRANNLRISTVPDSKESFTMTPMTVKNHSYQPNKSLTYPKVLDYFSQVEKDILFEDFMTLYTTDMAEGFTKLTDFLDDVEDNFDKMKKAGKITQMEKAVLSSIFIPSVIKAQLEDQDKYNAIMNFNNYMMTPAMKNEANTYTENILRNGEILEAFEKIRGISREDVLEAIKVQKIYQSDEFYESFKNDWNQTYEDAVKVSSTIFSSEILEETPEFIDWFKKSYGIDLDYVTYAKVYTFGWFPVKMHYVTKLYILHLLDKARKLDPDFDLLEYIKARTHLRILTNIALIKIAFLQQLNPYEYETFKMSDIIISNNLNLGMEYAFLFLVFNPVFNITMKAVGKYVTRPIVKWMVNRTVPAGGFGKTVLEWGNKYGRHAFESGETIKKGINAGDNDIFKRLVVQWSEPKRPYRVLSPEGEFHQPIKWRTRRKIAKEEVKRRAEAEYENGGWLFAEERRELYKELMQAIPKDLFVIKSGKLKLGEEEYLLRMFNQKWLNKHSMWKNIKWAFSLKHNAYYGYVGTATGAELKKVIQQRMYALAMTHMTLKNRLNFLYLEHLDVFGRGVQKNGKIVELDLIPFTERNAAKFFGEREPQAIISLRESELVVLDLRTLGKTEVVTGAKPDGTPIVESIAEFDMLANFLARDTKFKGNNPSEWELGEALCKYFKDHLKIDVDAVLVTEEKETIIKVVSDRLIQELWNSPRSYPTRPVLPGSTF